MNALSGATTSLSLDGVAERAFVGMEVIVKPRVGCPDPVLS